MGKHPHEDGAEQRGGDGPQGEVTEEDDHQQKHHQTAEGDAPVHQQRHDRPAEYAGPAVIPVHNRELVAHDQAEAGEQPPHRGGSGGVQKSAAQSDGDQTFQDVGQDNQRDAEGAVDPVIERQGGRQVLHFGLLPFQNPGKQICAVEISDKIRQYRGENQQKRGHSSRSPFCRTTIRTGVPSKPKVARIWFSR